MLVVGTTQDRAWVVTYSGIRLLFRGRVQPN